LDPSSAATVSVKPPSPPQGEQVTPPQQAVSTQNPARDSIFSQDELDVVNLPKEPSSRVKPNHPYKQPLGDVNEDLRLRNKVVNQVSYNCNLSQFEPKKIEEALQDGS
jgi:hypothetical protein